MLQVEYLDNSEADPCYKVYINYPEADACYNVYILISNPEADPCYNVYILILTTLKLTLVTSWILR